MIHFPTPDHIREALSEEPEPSVEETMWSFLMIEDRTAIGLIGLIAVAFFAAVWRL